MTLTKSVKNVNGINPQKLKIYSNIKDLLLLLPGEKMTLTTLITLLSLSQDMFTVSTTTDVILDKNISQAL